MREWYLSNISIDSLQIALILSFIYWATNIEQKSWTIFWFHNDVNTCYRVRFRPVATTQTQGQIWQTLKRPRLPESPPPPRQVWISAPTPMLSLSPPSCSTGRQSSSQCKRVRASSASVGPSLRSCCLLTTLSRCWIFNLL